MYTCIEREMCIHMFIYIHILMHTSPSLSLSVSLCLSLSLCIHMYIYICCFSYIYVYTYVIYIHICMYISHDITSTPYQVLADPSSLPTHPLTNTPIHAPCRRLSQRFEGWLAGEARGGDCWGLRSLENAYINIKFISFYI